MRPDIAFTAVAFVKEPVHAEGLSQVLPADPVAQDRILNVIFASGDGTVCDQLIFFKS